MTSVARPFTARRSLFRQPLDFVWTAWRTLTRRHFYYATLAGLGLGLSHGIGVMIWGRGIWWKSFLSVFVPSLAQVVFLLLCLSVAANVRVRRGPKWTPFAVAATVAAFITVAFGACIVGVSLFGARALSLVPNLANLSGYLLFSIIAGLGYMYGFDAVRRTDALRNLQLQRMRVAREAYEARLKALQARVEPRFLFDTLSDIEAAYATSPDSGHRIIDDLIVYLRAALPTMEESTSSLSAELTLVQAWLDIMRMRHGEGLTFSITAPACARVVKMPPMILLPLVQHAAECTRTCAERDIAVSAALDDRIARIVVTASGPGCELPVETAAIASIRERLLTLYATKASLDFVNTDRNEYRASLGFPT